MTRFAGGGGAFGMEMMQCPHCGAGNSVKRDYCFQCDGSLREEARPPEEKGEQQGLVPTCARCAQAAISPPLGKQITRDEVWCMEHEEAVPSGKVGGDCFREAFGWSREEILD
jgi:hypothetical protein